MTSVQASLANKNKNITDHEINLLSKGLKFIPTPLTKKQHIRRQLLQDFEQFARRMRLKYIFHGQNNKPHPYHVKSNWIPQVQPSVALESYLEEVKLQLAEIKLSQPKNNLSSKEREALQSLKRNKDLNVKKADKGSCVVIMDTENKINEGQTLLDNSKHYRPLDEPMVKETQYKVKQLIQELHENKNIDDMTKKWLSQTPSPPRIPIFYTLTKIHKPTPVGRPIISGCDGPTERKSAFLDRLLQPIAQRQTSYLKDSTDFIDFIESTEVPKHAIIVSMDVTSLYTNIPQEEGIKTICKAYVTHYKDKPPIPTRSLERTLNSIHSIFLEKITSKHTGQRWEQRSLLLSQISSWRK